MKNTHKGFASAAALGIVAVAFVVIAIVIYRGEQESIAPDIQKPATSTPSTMTITLYVQDKEAARTTDCRITKKEVHTIPWTLAVADASLKLLFSGDLYNYGVYKNVNVADGVAKVMLESENNRAGYPIGSLTSCEVGHLQAVLNDTLTQYESIKKVELYSPEGKIEF